METRTMTKEEILKDVPFHPKLLDLDLPPKKEEVIKVTEGVWVAVGYSFANSILVEGSTGLVIIDVTGSVAAATKILKEFRKISSKPIVAIIYTHFHGDHTFGTEGFIEDPQNPPTIWAHELMGPAKNETNAILARTSAGSKKQFGGFLGNQGTWHPSVRGESQNEPAIHQDVFIRGKESTVNIAGVDFTFLHLPGETKDHLVIWLEEKKVMMPGDNIYKYWPNIYAIRGTPARDSLEWCAALRKMRSLLPEYLVPSHLLPASGRQEIYDILTVYMSGIQFVHDQTVRYLNKGLHPDEVVQKIKLPSTLSSNPYLRELYGTVAWTSKAVYDQYVGWFNGDPLYLFPHTPRDRAQRMIDLIGQDQLIIAAETALASGDPQWALELASYLTTIQPDSAIGRELRGGALKVLAGCQENPLARNYYLSSVLENHGLLPLALDQTRTVEKSSMTKLLSLLKAQIKADEAEGLDLTVIFHFEDTNETFRLQLLHSVLSVESMVDADDVTNDLGSRHCDAKVTTTTRAWKDIFLSYATVDEAVDSGRLKLDESLSSLKQLMACFEH